MACITSFHSIVNPTRINKPMIKQTKAHVARRLRRVLCSRTHVRATVTALMAYPHEVFPSRRPRSSTVACGQETNPPKQGTCAGNGRQKRRPASAVFACGGGCLVPSGGTATPPTGQDAPAGSRRRRHHESSHCPPGLAQG